MLHDRLITITFGSSRRAVSWKPQKIMLSDFYEKLRIPARSTETMQEYLQLKKAEQDELKDVGGFVAGKFNGQRRKANTVQGRDLITLDLDNIPASGTDDVIRRVEGLGCGYCIYSTRKHSPAAPRLRVLIPLDRMASADEYEPLARYMATCIGMELVDPTTFEVARLMYFPSVCADSKYIYLYADKPMVSTDKLLQKINAEWGDWHDVTKWAQVPNAENIYRKLAIKQSDPVVKSGTVGAFCRTYDIYSAMDTYLKGIYEATKTPARYTYLRGSTTGGAVIYEDGKFLYSHHSTDPCCGKLVNAFDLVRLHRFADLDDTAEPKTPTCKLPSYLAMCRLAVQDTNVQMELAKNRAASAIADFEPVVNDFESATNDLDWAKTLEINPQTGTIKPTIDNFRIILDNDPNLKNKFALNDFTGRGEVLGNLPWSPFMDRRAWTDNDTFGLYWYLERIYKLSHNSKVDSALSLHSEKYKFNDVVDYLNSIIWDGKARLDKLLVDYLGAVDSEYTKAVTRKAFVAAVARALDPGCKYDTMLILSGKQGIGKSTLLDKMSKGWFNDNIRTFEGKEASELLQGAWLVEIGELDAFKKSDVARIKQFLSQRTDRFRAAYGRFVKEMPRRCVFFGTTNQTEFLRDDTGNRRFWAVDVGILKPTKNIWEDLDNEIDQIWAEAMVCWKLGESLHLSGELAETSMEVQEAHMESNAKEGIIAEFLELLIPRDWSKYTLEQRIVFLHSKHNGNLDLVKRDRICALEIWCEAFGGQVKDFGYREACEINGILKKFDGWKSTASSIRFGYCGKQRGFYRDTLDDLIKQKNLHHSVSEKFSDNFN